VNAVRGVKLSLALNGSMPGSRIFIGWAILCSRKKRLDLVERDGARST
jgi:hypothetical protein